MPTVAQTYPANQPTSHPAQNGATGGPSILSAVGGAVEHTPVGVVVGGAQTIAGGVKGTADAINSVNDLVAGLMKNPLRILFVVIGFTFLIIGVVKLFGGGVIPAGDNEDQSEEQIETAEEADDAEEARAAKKQASNSGAKGQAKAGAEEGGEAAAA